MIYTEEYIQSLYDLLEPCKEVMGHPEYHPEGTVWTHSFQTLRLALKETDDTDLILAAFMHDVGKQLNKLGHEYEGSLMMADYFACKGVWLVREHMRFWAMMKGEMKRNKKVRDMLEHPWLPALIALARWDSMARRPNYEWYISPEKLTVELNRKALLHFKEKPDEA